MIPLYNKSTDGSRSLFVFLPFIILVSYLIGEIIVNGKMVFLVLFFAVFLLWITFYILDWGINELRWILFASLIFLWISNITVLFSELGRIRLILGGVLTVLFIPLNYSKGIRNVLKRKQTFLTVLFIFFVSISYIIFGKRDIRWIRDSIPLLMILIWTTMLIKSRKDINTVEMILLIVISAFGLTGIINYFITSGINYRLSSAAGEYRGPNDIAYTFCLIIPLAISFLINTTNFRKKLVAFIVITICITATIATGSRGGLLVLFGISMITMGLSLKKKSFSIMFLVIGIAIVIQIISQFNILSKPIERIATITSIEFDNLESVPSMDSRLPSQRRALKLLS